MASECSCDVIKSLERESKRMKEKTRGERQTRQGKKQERKRKREVEDEGTMDEREDYAGVDRRHRSTYFLPGPHHILPHLVPSPIWRTCREISSVRDVMTYTPSWIAVHKWCDALDWRSSTSVAISGFWTFSNTPHEKHPCEKESCVNWTYARKERSLKDLMF